MVLFECFSFQVFVAQNLLVMQSTLLAFVDGAGAQRCAQLEEDARLEWRRAQTARLLLPKATCPGTWCWEAFQTQRLEIASRSAHRRHGLQCRRAGARSTSAVATHDVQSFFFSSIRLL